ncbi:head decoration protein [Rivihabitans pingtungensis]|uniref:head decoration protein n=1 Tax=Rivihabitans pingtungensis TaxID=1054498 RepID=UPI002354C06A|nr:head decoration protein [Rivihabitans pingtungensis]MCK6435978.1 head decoration protein [Rivihabitans pingtungensis]
MTASQQPRAGEHLVSTVGSLSNDYITLAAGPALPAGQVLAQDATTKEFAAYDNAAATLGKAVAVLYAPQSVRTAPTRAVATRRLAEVSGAGLTGLDDAATANLAEQHIIVR